MTSANTDQPIKCVLSLDPLLDFWREHLVPRCPHMAAMFTAFEKRIQETPGLSGAIEDPRLLADYQDVLTPLMTVAFPSAAWDTEISAAFPPFSMEAFFATPSCRERILDNQNQVTGRLKAPHENLENHKLMRIYAIILDKIYDMQVGVDTPLVRIVPDPITGMDRYYRITPDFTFIQVGTRGAPPVIDAATRLALTEAVTDPDRMREILPLDRFELSGFTIVRAMDVTEPSVIMELERDLIDQESMFSSEGFGRLESRLKVLFNRPEMGAGMGAIQGDQILVLSAGQATDANCLFRNSSHIPLEQVEGSVWMQAVEKKTIMRLSDIRTKIDRCPAEEDMMAHGHRAIMVTPLFYKGDVVGTLHVKSDTPGEFGPKDEMVMQQIAPLFSMALRRGLDDMNYEVQAIIKEKCTAVHPSVEWRFQQAAITHMEHQREGESSEMEPIIFKDVVPFFGQSDIRGSSEARIASIQADLIEQLRLAGQVVNRALGLKEWPLLDELAYQIDKRADGIRQGLTTEEETVVSGFLKNEVEPTFGELRRIGIPVAQAIDAYQAALDPELGVVYRKRKAFESSVSLLNERLSAFLDDRQNEAQGVFPHYFEKHQTDGVDYMIYLGASMNAEGQLNPFYRKNLALWQMTVACGMARITEALKPELQVPLDTCHLILSHRNPLAIRFRYDEKRFDVDGAYDVRHEIIKSRLDKAMIRGGRERLTQPGRLAVVYTGPAEGREIRKHIEYLQARGQLLDDLEQIDLDSLPGVSGLKALRVGIELAAAEAATPLAEATA